jgi:hypothetical protein
VTGLSASRVGSKRVNAASNIYATFSIAEECILPDGYVSVGGAVAEKRKCAVGCITGSAGVAQKRCDASSCILLCGIA